MSTPGTWDQRGSGARRRIILSTQAPDSWAAFLSVNLNKQEFFVEMAKSLTHVKLPHGKQLFTTILSDCMSSLAVADVGASAPSTHEEVDTRMVLHVAAATDAGHRQVSVRTSDSYVVVLGVSTFVILGQKIDELWIAFRMRRNFRYIPMHVMAHGLGQSRQWHCRHFMRLPDATRPQRSLAKAKRRPSLISGNPSLNSPYL